MYLTRTVAPATEPVTLTEAKAHLGVTISDDDTRITALIVAARETAENYTQRSFITQTWVAKLDAFPNGDIIELPKGPIQSITSVQYVDEDGDTQTFTEYTLDAAAERIFLNYDEDWPDTRDIENAVTITYVTGYGVAAAVPESIKSALKLKVECLYDRPDEAYAKALNGAADTILGQFSDMRRI